MNHTLLLRLLLTAPAIRGVTFAAAGMPSRAQATPPAVHAHSFQPIT